MNIRHPKNKNLTLHFAPDWNGMPVNINRGPLIVEFLDGIERTVWDATEDHLRTLVVRLDLHFPADGQEYDSSGAITRFIRSLRALIEADLERKQREGKRVHRCTVRHIWAREREESLNHHFHVAILVNHDDYPSTGPYEGPGGLAFMARQAWARVLGIELESSAGLVHLCGPGIVIDVNSDNFGTQHNAAFFALSYLAKAATKDYGDGGRNFDRTRCPGAADPFWRLSSTHPRHGVNF